jgi:DNA-binding transcriptional MerR regulator
MRMLWVTLAAVCVLAPGSASLAQDGANLEQVKKMYQDALNQLKEAQDRKSELASENARLSAHIADLERQLDTYKRDAAGEAERTFFLRSRYAAWEVFMKQYPELMERWKVWLSDGGAKIGSLPAMGDDEDWPFSAKG